MSNLTPTNYPEQEDIDAGSPSATGANFGTVQQTATHSLQALSAAAAGYASNPYPGSHARNVSATTLNAIDPSLEAGGNTVELTEAYKRERGDEVHGDAADQQLAQALLHAQQAEAARAEQPGVAT